MDTFNRFGVSVQGDNVLMLMPPRAPLTPNQALVLAAWLVAYIYHALRVARL